MLKKLKSYLEIDHIFYGILVLFVGVASFLSGRYSIMEDLENMADNDFLMQSEVSDAEKTISSSTKVAVKSQGGEEVVASKSGTRYHLLSCPGAKTIKPENLITFSSIKEAEAGGYKRAQNCP
jgi:hypothetical protein